MIQNLRHKINDFFKLLRKTKMLIPFLGVSLSYIFILLISLIVAPTVGVLLLILILIIWFFGNRQFKHYVEHLAAELTAVHNKMAVVQEDALYQSPVAALIYSDEGVVRWLNPAMQSVFGSVVVLGKKISSINETLDRKSVV